MLHKAYFLESGDNEDNGEFHLPSRLGNIKK
jgi:hypothetical protein